MLKELDYDKAVRLNKSRNRDVSMFKDPTTGHEFVVKRYPDEDEAEREYQALNRCQDNPHLPRLFNYYEQDGHWYIVMEFIKGDNLDDVLAQVGPLDFNKTIDLALDILDGIRALHQRGYVHGDLRGKNVMVEDLANARTRIIDLQHAVKKLSNGQAKAVRKPKKPHLMLAPESRIGTIDDRYDIYSVGHMCACMLAGTKLDHRLKESDLDDRVLPLLKVIRKAMHRKPRKRYRSADAMSRALRRAREKLSNPSAQRGRTKRENAPGK